MPFNFKIPFHRNLNSGDLTEEEKLEKLKEFIIEQEKTAQSMCDNPDDVKKEAPTRKFNYSKEGVDNFYACSPTNLQKINEKIYIYRKFKTSTIYNKNS